MCKECRVGVGKKEFEKVYNAAMEGSTHNFLFLNFQHPNGERFYKCFKPLKDEHKSDETSPIQLE